MTLYSVVQVAEMLGVSRQRVQQLIHAGQLKATKVGSSFVITQPALQDLLAHRLKKERSGLGYFR